MTNKHFEKLRSSQIPSLNVEIEEYVHTPTGAKHFHFSSNDSNNGFLVAFLTVPHDSTGVAHILEHTSLCGSAQFPIRDPFFMMIRRSLATFMNAFTSSDWTAYPFATQNEKDYDNLLRVYLDAVFFPRLDAMDFAQEGHRLEPADPSQPDSGMTIKGVVYNEMKGVMSQPTSRLYQALQSSLFPTTSYHNNHGGDPAVIPDLTHEALVEFHSRHYHPSNAVIMTYGNIPPQRHQSRIHELALSRFDRMDQDISIADEVRFDEPRTIEARFPLAPAESTAQKTHVVLGWLLGHSADLGEIMNAHLVSDVLLAHSGSPLRMALETTDLGTSPSALTGLQASTREAVFSCGIEGTQPDRAEDVQKLVLDTLGRVAEDGIPTEDVEAVLHQLELAQREVGGGDFPYGLQLMLQGLPAILHDGDPVAFLDIDPVLVELRERIADPSFLPKQVVTLLLDNPHRVRLTMTPDHGLADEELEAEQSRVDRMTADLDDEQIEGIRELAKALEVRQRTPEDPEVLPRVTTEDIPETKHIPEWDCTRINGIESTWFEAATNGLVYEQVTVALPALDENLIDNLALFSTCLSEVGSAGRSYLDTQARQMAISGGVGARARIRGTLDDVQRLGAFFSVGTKALARNTDGALELLEQTFRTARFDETDRLGDLVAQMRAGRERGVVSQGHAMAMKAATAGFSPQAALSHRLGGLLGIQRLKTLDESFDTPGNLDGFAHELERIRDSLITRPVRLLMVGEKANRDRMQKSSEALFTSNPKNGSVNDFSLDHDPCMVKQAWTTSTQVNFCAKAFPTVSPSHPDAPILTLLGPLLRNGFLHTAIREQGGAYGSGAAYDPDSAAFRFFSYRDPRLVETLEDFDRSIDWATGKGLEPRLLEEAVLNVISRIDSPDPPAGEAIGTYYMNLHGRTPEVRRRFRADILSVTMADIQRVAGRYLDPARASVAVVTDASRLDQLEDLELDHIAL